MARARVAHLRVVHLDAVDRHVDLHWLRRASVMRTGPGPGSQWRETSAAHRVFCHGPGLAVRQGVQGIVRAAALSDGERDGEHDVVVARRRFAEFRPRVEVREHGVEIHWSGTGTG